MRKGQITLNLNAEFRKIVKVNFNTEDEAEIKALILKFLENGDIESLSLKDQYLLERISKLRRLLPLQERKLELQNEILEKKRDFLYHFKAEISNEGSQILKTETRKKYGFATSQNISENIQLKKNFFIDKHSDGTYCGVCKVCQNFTTSICSTSREAEGDIELHLESVHHAELYQR